MNNNRRDWLKKAVFGALGISAIKLETFASEPLVKSGEYLLDDPILLNLNENPYGPSPMALKAMHESIHMCNRYHQMLKSELISAIAAKNEVSPDSVFVGAGSTAIFDMVLQHAALEKGSFILADPSYDYWTDTAEALGLTKISVPLDSDKKHDLTAMLNAIQPDTRLIYICNPNNPTGTICEKEDLRAFIEEATKKTLVVVDEAYIEYTMQDSLSVIATQNSNLIITRTFSKMYGLAGARVGYAVATPSSIDKLRELSSWVNQDVSVASASAALAVLNDVEFMKETLLLNEKAREYTISQLEKLTIPSIPSVTNFIYFSLSKYSKDFFMQLENKNIIGTRIYKKKGKWTRITIGTMHEMEQFIQALK